MCELVILKRLSVTLMRIFSYKFVFLFCFMLDFFLLLFVCLFIFAKLNNADQLMNVLKISMSIY